MARFYRLLFCRFSSLHRYRHKSFFALCAFLVKHNEFRSDKNRSSCVRRFLTSYVSLVTIFLLASCASPRYESYWEPHTVVASWYGNEFHGRQTASGERFDMYRLTCAHRELPFGTVLEVMNVSNGKSVKCTVNDRGPFVSGRGLDLSYACAKEIGLDGIGTVRISYLGRDMNYIRGAKYAATEGPFAIQIGSFTEQTNALHLKASLELKYKGVYIIEAWIKNTVYYRVRVGKYLTRTEASGLAKTLADEGYSPWVVHYDERV